MSIINEIHRGNYPESLGLDSVLDLASDSGRFNMAWLALEMESRAHSGEYCGVTFKDTPSKWGLNTLKKAAGKPLLNEPVLTRQAVKNMFEDLGIDLIPENALIRKWLEGMESGLLNWVDIGLWRLHEAAFLLCGKEPPSDGRFDKSLHAGGDPARVYRDLKDAIDLGEITALPTRTGQVQHKRVKPADVVTWARCRGYSIPHEIDSAFPVQNQNPRSNDTRKRGDDYIPALSAIFAEIEKRASQKGIRYQRDKTPGNKHLIRRLIQLENPVLHGDLPESKKRFTEALNRAGVKFLSGRNESKGISFFETLFPEHEGKIGPHEFSS